MRAGLAGNGIISVILMCLRYLADANHYQVVSWGRFCVTGFGNEEGQIPVMAAGNSYAIAFELTRLLPDAGSFTFTRGEP